MPIYYAGKVTKQEYLKSFILHSSRIRQRKWFFGFAILVIIVGAIVMRNQNPRMLTDYAPSLLFALLFLSYPWWTPYLSLLSYGQKGNFFHSNLHGTISDNTITINGEKLQIELQWTAFIDYKIDKDLVLLYQGPNQFSIFVRSMFSNQNQWEKFATMAKEKTALNKKRGEPNMKLKTFENKMGEGLVAFEPWQTRGPEYQKDNSRWYCHITVAGERIFEYASPCGTCGILFKKLRSPADQISDSEAVKLLGKLDKIPSDAILERLARVLEPDTYHPIIMEGKVEYITPGTPSDYFATEVLQVFGPEPPEYENPINPGTTYYRFGPNFEMDRTGRRTGPHKALITSIVMPLHDPTQLNQERVVFWKQQYKNGARLTALAVSVIDNQAPFDAPYNHEYPYKEMFLLTHCLLDGHHRVQAAAELGVPIRILSFLSRKFSRLEKEDDLVAVTDKYSH